jgi:hypothetical protein
MKNKVERIRTKARRMKKLNKRRMRIVEADKKKAKGLKKTG